MSLGFPIVDCHHHFYDSRRLNYGVFTAPSEGFAAVVGDYAALPRIYGPEDYARDAAGLNVACSVWAEFISDDPLGEVHWAAATIGQANRETSLIASLDFADPALDHLLDAYQEVGSVRCVRQHMGWHPTQKLLRFTAEPHMMEHAAWRRGLLSLHARNLICEIEIFSPQLSEFATMAAEYPDIQFVLPVMGWPIDLSAEGRLSWKRDLSTVGKCPNVALKIFGLECIFGIHWKTAQVRPWILDAIDIFAPSRCLFASHMPICKLACSFEQLYAIYDEITATFTQTERRSMFHDNAANLYLSAKPQNNIHFG